jgi:hypothetical protein
VTRAFKRIVQGMFAESPDTLADFGLKPLKVGARTVATKVDAIARAAATRKARHTMGSQQKKEVKGDVTGITVTPVVTPPAASGSTAPLPPTATPHTP